LLKGSRQAWFDGAFADTQVYDYDALGHDDVIEGPALVEAPHTTFVVNPGWRLSQLDSYFIEMRHTA
jgi:N-methylhydantoinase A